MVRHFPQFLPGEYMKNYVRASRWLKLLENYPSINFSRPRYGEVYSHAHSGVKNVKYKSPHGRGRKNLEWSQELVKDFITEYELLKAYGVKITTELLRRIEFYLISKESDGCSIDPYLSVGQ